MKKLLEKSKEEIAEYYCDGCSKLVCISGIPMFDDKNNTGREFCLQVRGNFGYNSPADVLAFTKNYCGDCGIKIVELIEKEFNTKIESTIFESDEDSDWQPISLCYNY